MFKFFGMALLALCLILIVKRYSSDFSLLLKSSSGVLALGACIIMLTPIINFIAELSGAYLPDGVEVYFSLLLRALAIGYLTHICSTLCRDCGEATIASYVELGGKIEILIISIPLFKEVLGLVKKMLEM